MSNKAKENKNYTQISFNRNVPIPEPVEKQKRGDKWVSWGEDNLYPQFLNQIYYDSPYQSGIINGKVLFITGSGIEEEATDAENLLQLKQFLANSNSDFNCDEIINNVALDLEIYNGFAIKGVWNKDGSLGYIEHLDFDKVRQSEDGDMYYYSCDWSTKKQSYEKTQYQEYEPYNPEIKRGSFLFYYRVSNKTYPQGSKKQLDLGIYPKPTYSGGILDVVSDIDISGFHSYEIKNGMKAGTLITLTGGVPSDEEKRAVEAGYRNGLTNIEGSGGVMIHFVEGQEEIPDIQNLNGNDLDKRYLLTEEAVRKKIYVAHSVVSPTIFGLPSANGLGSQTEMETAYYIFVKTYVRGRQKIIEDAINFLIQEAGITGSIKLREPEQFFEKNLEEVEAEEVMEKEDDFAAKNVRNFNDVLIGKMAQMGRPKTKGRVVASREVNKELATQDNEERFVKDLKNQVYYFLDVLDDFHLNVLNLLSEGNEADSIAEALKVKDKKVTAAISGLREGGYLKKDYTVSKRGERILQVEGRELQEFEIVYTYEKRIEEDGPAILPNDRTRPFCEALIKLDREYTRLEIESLNSLSPFAKDGLDVWNYRGGWYNKDGTNRPSCRHIWKQKVIVK